MSEPKEQRLDTQYRHRSCRPHRSGRDTRLGTRPDQRRASMPVLGVGGIFFRAQDPDALNAWYREHLGVGAGCAVEGTAGRRMVVDSSGRAARLRALRGDNRLLDGGKTVHAQPACQRPRRHARTTQRQRRHGDRQARMGLRRGRAFRADTRSGRQCDRVVGATVSARGRRPRWFRWTLGVDETSATAAEMVVLLRLQT